MRELNEEETKKICDELSYLYRYYQTVKIPLQTPVQSDSLDGVRISGMDFGSSVWGTLLHFLDFGEWKKIETSFGEWVFPLLWPPEKVKDEAWGNQYFIDRVLDNKRWV